MTSNVIALPICTDKSRRSKRRRGVGGRATKPEHKRTSKLQTRCEQHEIEKWLACSEREGYLGLSDWVRDRLNAAADSRKHTSSEDDSWNSPAVIFEWLAPMGAIALDPCSNARSIVPARRAIALPDDGLRAPRVRYSDGLGYNYENPPYGKQLPAWIEAQINAARLGCEEVLLLPARVDTQWFDQLQTSFDVALLRGRLTFLGAPYPALFPSCLAYMGPRRELFRTCVDAVATRIMPAVRPAWRKQLALVKPIRSRAR